MGKFLGIDGKYHEEGSLLPFLGFSKSACCAKSAKRRAQEADVIRRTVVAKGAERISPQRQKAWFSAGIRSRNQL